MSVRAERGQSEVVGSILLVAVIVLGVSIIGAIVLGDIASQDQPVSAVIEGNATSGTVTFEHGGGDPIATSELRVVVQNDSGASQEIDFTPANITQGDGDDRFEPGEHWEHHNPYGGSDTVRLVLVHEPTGEVLFEGRRQVG